MARYKFIPTLARINTYLAHTPTPPPNQTTSFIFNHSFPNKTKLHQLYGQTSRNMFARLYSLVCPTMLASERQIFIPEWKIRCPWASDHQLVENRRPIYVSTVAVSAAHIPGGIELRGVSKPWSTGIQVLRPLFTSPALVRRRKRKRLGW